MEIRLRLDGRVHDVALQEDGDGWVATVDGVRMPLRPGQDGYVDVAGVAVEIGEVTDAWALLDGVRTPYAIEGLRGVAGADGQGGQPAGHVRAPMTGKVVLVAAVPGRAVEAGDVLFVLEAMKMQNEVRAPRAGTVQAVHAKPGAAVAADTVVVELD